MKNAVMYGAGNIGRGFIGALFARSGYRVTFIDIDTALVDRLADQGRYPLRIIADAGSSDIEIKNVTAINGRDQELVARTIAGADIMATAVGVNVLKFIAPNIAAGIRRRFSLTDIPLNIIICENLIDADKLLAELINAELNPAEINLFARKIGLVEASIGRMVPVQTPQMQQGEPLRVCVEPYSYLPVDKDAFKGEIPEIANMVPFSPFSFYIKRKLYIHNLGHAICAYFGDYSNREFIYEAIGDCAVLQLVENAMLESAVALARQYEVPFADLLAHIHDLLFRFTNTALRDTCQRVGADPRRKLSAQDRLIGAATNCLNQKIQPVYIAAGIAAAVLRLLREESRDITEQNAQNVLTEISGLTEDNPLPQLVLPFFSLLKNGASISEIRRLAAKTKAETQQNII